MHSTEHLRKFRITREPNAWAWARARFWLSAPLSLGWTLFGKACAQQVRRDLLSNKSTAQRKQAGADTNAWRGDFRTFYFIWQAQSATIDSGLRPKP